MVVGDGCSSGASSEVGARLGVRLFARALAARLQSGACVTAVETWSAVRGDVVRALWQVLEAMTGVRGDDTRRCGDITGVAIRERAIHDMFLFTIVAAAATRDGAAVWALGDGAYSFALDDGHYSLAGRSAGTTRREARVLGPFRDNAPPYLGYDLLGHDLLGVECEPRFEVAPADASAIVIATDGVLDLDIERDLDLATNGGLARFARDEYLEHPDKLRRELSLLARAQERMDWENRRVVRTPAVLQDDCAIGVLRWRQP